MAIMSLPPGFRFYPTNVELVKYYLKKKVLGKKLPDNVIAEVDIYKNEPWDLPGKSYLRSGDMKWYFYCPREKKYASGDRKNRATECGFWKTTGRDRSVLQDGKPVGMIKTLIYHQGRPSKADRTDWVMHEYRLDEKDLADRGVAQDDFVLCVIFQKEGRGPRNGAQYGAPFKEDWSDDDDDYAPGITLSETQPAPVLLLPSQSHPVVTTMPAFESTCSASTSGRAQSDILLSGEKLLPVENDDSSMLDLPQVQEDGDFLSMFDLVEEEHGPDSTENNKTELLNNSNQGNDVVVAATCTDGGDIFFENLGDLRRWFGFCENGARFGSDNTVADYNMDQVAGDQGDFVQLTDLDTPLNAALGGSRNELPNHLSQHTLPRFTIAQKSPDFDHYLHQAFKADRAPDSGSHGQTDGFS